MISTLSTPAITAARSHPRLTGVRTFMHKASHRAYVFHAIQDGLASNRATERSLNTAIYGSTPQGYPLDVLLTRKGCRFPCFLLVVFDAFGVGDDVADVCFVAVDGV